MALYACALMFKCTLSVWMSLSVHSCVSQLHVLCTFSVFLFSFMPSFCVSACTDIKKEKKKYARVSLLARASGSVMEDLLCCSLGKEFLTRVKHKHTEIRITSSSAAKKCWLFSQGCGLEALEFLFKVVRTGTLWCQIYPLKVFPRTKLARNIWSTFKTGFYLVLCCERVCAFLNDLKGGSN